MVLPDGGQVPHGQAQARCVPVAGLTRPFKGEGGQGFRGGPVALAQAIFQSHILRGGVLSFEKVAP